MIPDSIFLYYEDLSKYNKAICIDLLDDIIHSHKSIEKLNSNLAEARIKLQNLYKGSITFHKIPERQSQSFIIFEKVLNFNDGLRTLLTIPFSENEICAIRGQRYMFTEVLINSGIISYTENEKNIEHKNDENQEFIKMMNKYFIKINDKGEARISFQDVTEENGMLKIGDKKYFIENPENITIFLYHSLLKNIIKMYGRKRINDSIKKVFECDVPEESDELDDDIIKGINYKNIADIEKLRKYLLNNGEKEGIFAYKFANGELYINGENKPFKLSKESSRSIPILRFICFYCEHNPKSKRISGGELKLFLRENPEFSVGVIEEDVEIDKLEKSFLRTFKNNIEKKYKFNNIFMKEKSQPYLLLKE